MQPNFSWMGTRLVKKNIKGISMDKKHKIKVLPFLEAVHFFQKKNT